MLRGTLHSKPWPNQLGHDVFDVGPHPELFIGEVCDDPEEPGVYVRTIDESGRLVKFLDLQHKLDPCEAVRRCIAEGRPIEEE